MFIKFLLRSTEHVLNMCELVVHNKATPPLHNTFLGSSKHYVTDGQVHKVGGIRERRI